MEKNRKYYLLSFIILIIVLSFIFTFLFVLNWSAVTQTYNDMVGIPLLITLIVLRTAILSGISFFLLNKWLNQEEIFLSDAYFLFALYFFILAIAKVLDLFRNLTYYYLEASYALILFKVRYVIIILDFIPLFYLGLGVILFYLSESRELSWQERKVNRIRKIMMATITTVEALIIVLSPSIDALATTLPLFVIPSLLFIVYMFLFSYKNKRISQVHSLIVAIGFIFYCLSSIIRAPLITADKTAYTICFMETLDTIIFSLIFMGFIIKPNYAK